MPKGDEETTRARMIDVQLRKAGWMASHQRMIEEFVVTSPNPDESSTFADYALTNNRNEPLPRSRDLLTKTTRSMTVCGFRLLRRLAGTARRPQS